jgi:hypothetical protein
MAVVSSVGTDTRGGAGSPGKAPGGGGGQVLLPWDWAASAQEVGSQPMGMCCPHTGAKLDITTISFLPGSDPCGHVSRQFHVPFREILGIPRDRLELRPQRCWHEGKKQDSRSRGKGEQDQSSPDARPWPWRASHCVRSFCRWGECLWGRDEVSLEDKCDFCLLLHDQSSLVKLRERMGRKTTQRGFWLKKMEAWSVIGMWFKCVPHRSTCGRLCPQCGDVGGGDF